MRNRPSNSFSFEILFIIFIALIIALVFSAYGCASSQIKPNIDSLSESKYPNAITLSTKIPADDKDIELVGKFLRLGYYPTTRYELRETWANPFELRAFITFSKNWIPINRICSLRFDYCDCCFIDQRVLNSPIYWFKDPRNGMKYSSGMKIKPCKDCKALKEMQ